MSIVPDGTDRHCYVNECDGIFKAWFVENILFVSGHVV